MSLVLDNPFKIWKKPLILIRANNPGKFQQYIGGNCVAANIKLSLVARTFKESVGSRRTLATLTFSMNSDGYEKAERNENFLASHRTRISRIPSFSKRRNTALLEEFSSYTIDDRTLRTCPICWNNFLLCMHG